LIDDCISLSYHLAFSPYCQKVSETYNSGDTVVFIFPDGTGPALLSCLIAGIPLNRAHELRFAPGEVRMDITYDSVRAFLPAEPTPEYLEAIERGKVELERLRTTVDVVSVREEEYTKQVQEQQAAAAEWAQNNSKRREEKRMERQQRNEAATAKRQGALLKEKRGESQRTYGEQRNNEIEATNKNGKKVDGANPLLFSVAALGLLSTFKPAHTLSEDLGTKRSAESTNQYDLVKGGATAVVEEDAEPVRNSTSSHFAELDDMEERVEEGGFEIPDFTSHQEGDGLYANPAPIRDEEQLPMDATKAMQEYLNRDDGAQDFDSMMTELLCED
jgi:hypothetical protein